MRRRKLVLFFLSALPLIAALALYPDLPERIPAHYGFSGKVDRWGDKSEIFLIPAIILITGLIILITAHLVARGGEEKRKNAGAALWAGIAIALFFNVLSGLILYANARLITDIGAGANDISRVMTAVLGVLFIIMGPILPRLGRNAMFGVRTGWSMKNDAAWKMTQRFAGKTCVVSGILMILSALILRGGASLFAGMAILFVMTIVDVWYSSVAARKC